jgi:transposase
MPNRRKGTMDIRAILHHLRGGASDRRISRELGIDRRTVKKYRGWAETQGLLHDALPPIEALQQLVNTTLTEKPPPQNESTVSQYGERIQQLHTEGVEAAAIHQRLQEAGYCGSYWPVYRFVRKLKAMPLDVTVRVECPPGEEAQVDFGFAGQMVDPTSGALRKAWAFVMTLSWSRHQYVEFVFDQKVETWLALHRNALSYFGGVPQRLVIDNLKAGITQACWDDPQVQHAYRECAEHYGFLIAPCRPRTPQHKGKVEQGGVHYVKRNFLGGRQPTLLTQANRDVLRWCETTAGQRVHGTHKEQPLLRFQQTEQARLQPLPSAAYDLAVWKELKLHRDCHLVFDNAYYSAPFQLVGQRLRVKGGSRSVYIYTLDYHLVATHERAQQPGQRQTNPSHLPPELLDGLYLGHEGCCTTAQDIGPATSELVQRLFEDRILDRLPTVRRLLKLRERFGDVRLEAACQRALAFEDARYLTVKRILETGQDLTVATPSDNPSVAERPLGFVRSAAELVGHLFGGVTWN